MTFPHTGRLRTALRINNRSCRQSIWTLLNPAPLPADWRLPYIPADAFAYNAGRMNLAGNLGGAAENAESN